MLVYLNQFALLTTVVLFVSTTNIYFDFFVSNEKLAYSFRQEAMTMHVVQ
jgi:hypothetical protein